MRGEALADPADPVSGVIHDRGAESGFLDLAVQVEQRAGPAQIDIFRIKTGIRGIVGNRVAHGPRVTVIGIHPVAARGDEFKRRDNVIRRRHYLIEAHVGAEQRSLQHERKLHFETRIREITGGNPASVRKHHIVEQHVHNLDIMQWIMGVPPVRAIGLGGRLPIASWLSPIGSR